MSADLGGKHKRRRLLRPSARQPPQDPATTIASSLPLRPAASDASLATGNHLLDQTLERLSTQDRQTLNVYISPDSCDSALRDALAVAKQNQQTCLNKRWTVRVAGRSVLLRDQADKIVKWLNRFKAVGDIAVNADPVCAGLPWAGIRLLLEAAVSETNHMALLLVGCETALYLANRLTVYTKWLQQLHIGISRQNLEIAIARLYACILGFLAEAIRTYQTSSIRRLFSSVWTEGSITNFEKTANELAQNVETEASNCDRVAYSRDVLRVLEELQQTRRLQTSQDLETKLDKIPWANGAIFNSHDSTHRACHPQTRIDVLDQIRDWIRDCDSKAIFWLSGPAGTGKSTISWTIANELANQSNQLNPGSQTDQNSQANIVLGASFFFKRGEGDRGSSYRFFSTIIRQLVVNIPELDHLIAEAIRLDPFIFDKALSEQFNKLILAPLAITTSTFVVVVDALDECDNEDHIRIILRLWSLLPRARLKLFLTSRPETPIRLEFSAMPERHQHLKLEPSPTLQQDLAVYIRDEFQQIQAEHPELSGHDWISQDTLDRFVHLSYPLFIIAATICRFVSDPNWDPQDRLSEILQRSTGQLSQMERTYLPVLDSLLAKTRRSDDKRLLAEQFHAVVGSIVCLVEPLSVANLANLIKIPPRLVSRRLDPLHSVLSIPDDDLPVRTLHLSFPEFLLARGDQNKPFGICAPKMHFKLRDCCLHLLSSKLKQNLLGLMPGDLRQNVDHRLLEMLCPACRYACRYWVHHHKEAHMRIEDNDDVDVFLQRHFLHWLEALSLINCLAEAMSFTEVLIAYASPNVLKFLEDAQRFVLANQYIIDLAPLQVYISGSVFAPQMSRVRALCKVPEWLLRHPEAPMVWGPERQQLQGHVKPVSAIAFSLDGSILASGSDDKTVRFWDVKTGREIQKLSHSECVRTVAFLPNGFTLVSATSDGVIRFWDIHTGQEVRYFKTEEETRRATFSSDGCLIALGLDDGTVNLWDTETGQKMKTLGRHNKEVKFLAFSTDDSLLASGSWDGRVRIWDVRVGQLFQMSPDTGGTACFAFSPDNSVLAMVAGNSIFISDANTWEDVQSLEHHIQITAAVFSPDGSLLASSVIGGTIYIWDTRTWQKVQTLKGCDTFVDALKFSHGGLLASGSISGSIRFWDVRTDQETPTSEQETEGTSLFVRTGKAMFSPDGSLLAVAAYSRPLDLYDAQTGQKIRPRPVYSRSPIIFSPSYPLVALTSDSEIRLWNLSTERTERRYVHQNVQSIAFSPNGSLLASTSRDRTVRIWDATAGHELHNLSLESKKEASVVAFSPDGSLLARAGYDDTLVVWDVVTGHIRKEMSYIRDNGNWARAIAISQSGDILILCDTNEILRLFETNTGQEVRTIEDMPGVTEIQFTQDDQSLTTNRGVLTFGHDYSVNPHSTIYHGDWIQSGNTKLVWLPRDNRGFHTAFHDGLVAIKQDSGVVGFWELGSSSEWKI